MVAYTGKDNSTFRCTTHDWTILHAIEPGYSCPIGRIENRADQAINNLSAETKAVVWDAIQEMRAVSESDATELLRWGREQALKED
jgi:hypothetical protein